MLYVHIDKANLLQHPFCKLVPRVDHKLGEVIALSSKIPLSCTAEIVMNEMNIDKKINTSQFLVHVQSVCCSSRATLSKVERTKLVLPVE